MSISNEYQGKSPWVFRLVYGPSSPLDVYFELLFLDIEIVQRAFGRFVCFTPVVYICMFAQAPERKMFWWIECWSGSMKLSLRIQSTYTQLTIRGFIQTNFAYLIAICLGIWVSLIPSASVSGFTSQLVNVSNLFSLSLGTSKRIPFLEAYATLFQDRKPCLQCRNSLCF